MNFKEFLMTFTLKIVAVLLIAATSFAADSSVPSPANDSNNKSKTVEELKAPKPLEAPTDIQVCFECNVARMSGCDISLGPPIIPSASTDPCKPPQAVDGSGGSNKTDQ